jgi:anti-sigma regulatory factor (Ser/Thr protein kinase)
MTNREGGHAGAVSDGEALRRMYRITADHERPFEEKLRELLDLGRTYLGVEAGFLTEITEDTQLIVEASGEHEPLQAGESCPLSRAYCRKTIEREAALTVQHAAVEGWEDDAAYEEFGLEAYIGAKVLVDGEVYGTFCFADSAPREVPFGDDEETFVELMAEWVSYELFQQRATARIEQQRDQLEEFASVVSHDLRNPLGVVQGYLDLAEKTGDPEHFERCRNALDRMGALIDDLLVLAREGEAIAETESLSLAELTRESWSFVGTEEARLIVETDAVIHGDWSRLQQLFENLFRNAVEHAGEDVTVRVGRLADGIYVEDDGPGIPEGDREAVFDDGYSTSRKGTGFGLTIAEQIVDAHGWEIAVTGSDDGGARFEITGVDVIEDGD